jgi:hypothetical protein
VPTRRKIVRGVPMMLISLGAMLLALVAFIWLYDPDGIQKISHKRSALREENYKLLITE